MNPHLSAQVRHVVEAATLAPSVHNTQPWRFVVGPEGFDLHADESRRLPVLDPFGRQLHLSCGAALVTARVAARALGLDADVVLLPDPQQPDLLARLALRPGAPATDDEVALALAVLKRHTVREAFDPEPLPEVLLEALARVAEAEGAALKVLRGGEPGELETLLSRADAAEERDPAYRQETSSWVRPPDAGDGIPPQALPGDEVRASPVRLRDFRLAEPQHGSGEAPPAEHPELVVLTTAEDDPLSWLQGGQALGAVLLHAAAAGVQAQPLGQVTDLPGWRYRLAAVLGLVGTPQLVLRVGFAHGVARTPRRALDDVLV